MRAHKTRVGHEKVTQTKSAAKARIDFVKKNVPGPHKTWASKIRATLAELSIGQKAAELELGVRPGWYKKAINGWKVDGAFREAFETKLIAAWDAYRTNHTELGPLRFPPYDQNISLASDVTEESKSLDSFATPAARMLIALPEIIYPNPAGKDVVASAKNDAIDGTQLTLAEGAWPLHQELDKPYAMIARTIDKALDEGNIDLAFSEFRRSLFFTGYHEEWKIRRTLTKKMLKAKLEPRDAAWVHLKAEAYMDMELGNFALSKAAIAKALQLYMQGNLPEGVGQCFRYLGDLQAKFGAVGEAFSSKVESLKHLNGIPALEAKLEIRLLELQHLTEPSKDKINKLTVLAEQFREIKSWRYWLTEIERAKTIAAMGGWRDALTVAKYVEFAFRSEIKMERTRKRAVRLIEDIEKNKNCKF